MIPRFRVTTVFDVSQTDGDPLPDLGVEELTADVENYDTFMGAIRQVSPVPIRFDEISGDAKGYYDLAAKEIVIRDGMSESQTLKTAIHETAHARLHDRDVMEAEGTQKDRMTREVEAESIAYTVCQHFGIDTSDYTFPYVASWSSGREMKELRASMDTIRNSSSEMIDEITAAVQSLEKEQIRYEEVEIFGVPALYSETLIARGDVPEGLNSYQLRGSDEDPGEPATVENFVRVNHAGTILTFQELPIPHRGYLPLGDGLNFTGEQLTVQQYRQRTSELSAFEVEETMSGQIAAARQESGLSLPDASIGLAQMHEYGYVEEDMYPLTGERALQLQAAGAKIYALHTNGTASELTSREAIAANRGIYGIKRENWEQLRSEDILLHGSEDRYGIYQIKDDGVGRDYRFLDLNLVTDRGYVVNHGAYELMYSDRLNLEDTLDSLYVRFNQDRPDDFTGHSLSVSDVVVLNRGGEVQAYYVDSIGFRELPDFFEEIKQKQHVTELTDGLAVEGHYGTWHTIDQTESGGEKFFLMEHDEYGDSAASIVVNEEGKLVADDVWNGFSTDVMDTIDEYLDDKENAEEQEHSAESEEPAEEKTEAEAAAGEKATVAETAVVFVPIYMHDAAYAPGHNDITKRYSALKSIVKGGVRL